MHAIYVTQRHGVGAGTVSDLQLGPRCDASWDEVVLVSAATP